MVQHLARHWSTADFDAIAVLGQVKRGVRYGWSGCPCVYHIYIYYIYNIYHIDICVIILEVNVLMYIYIIVI